MWQELENWSDLIESFETEVSYNANGTLGNNKFIIKTIACFATIGLMDLLNISMIIITETLVPEHI